tara:strand:- start:12675 stop:13034 length:360 start_codon:yes stop_codon:yes gene_type:complete
MVNKRYQAGYRFEKRVANQVREILDNPSILYYIIESRGSKGKADIVVGLYHKPTGNRFWFGIQCKKGYISKPEQGRLATAARKENGMLLFFATRDSATGKVIYNPDLKEWTKQWVTETI